MSAITDAKTTSSASASKSVISCLKRTALSSVINPSYLPVEPDILLFKLQKPLSVRDHFQPSITRLKEQHHPVKNFVFNMPSNAEEPFSIGLDFASESDEIAPRELTYKLKPEFTALIESICASEEETACICTLIRRCANIENLSCALGPVDVRFRGRDIEVECHNMAVMISARWCRQLTTEVPLYDIVIDGDARSWTFKMKRQKLHQYNDLFGCD